MLTETSFTVEQAERYIKALISVAMADGKIDPREKDFVDSQAQLQGIDSEPLWENSEDITGEVLGELSVFQKKIFIRDCIVLGYIDGDFCSDERKKLEEMCKKIGVEISSISEIEDWLKRFWKILEEGKSIFGS